MDWMKLFALLIAVASIRISAEGSKKKIRIHLPQRVKHIHHHKKIYITNHHASESSQYAPTFLSNADNAVAVPSNIALPSVSNVVPLNSVELIGNHQHRIPGISPAASKLLPLYRARGYYGPTPSEWDEQEYDIAAPSEPGDNTYPPAPHVQPTSAPPPAPPPKRVKIVKVEKKPKKAPQRVKEKRVPVRSRPVTEEEHPVSKYHEQFYSDLEGPRTIKKVKKPQRVEKIVDGDTEHIHTYSEEHIHKLVFDDGSKLSNIVGVDPIGSMSGITAGHPLMPFKNSLLAIPSGTYSAFTVGSLGTPSHLEYTAYNPRDVTHDHVFHDHGEIPPDVDLNRDPLGFPPKVSYNSQGLAISDGAKGHKAKFSQKYLRPTKPSIANELSYYESLYSNNKIKKQPNAAVVPNFESSVNSGPEQDFRPVPSFNSIPKNPNKIRSTYYNGPTQDFRPKHGLNLAPYSVSSTIVHDYQPKPTYPGALPPTGFSKFKDNVANFHSNNYDYDAYASSSNILFSEDKNDNSEIPRHSYKGKKKSVSTQNISFGGQDHLTMVDHFGASSDASESLHEDPSAFEDVNSYDNGKASDSISPTPYTIKETSPAHSYYTSMAIKALYNEPASMPEASNDNLQYAEPPSTPEATTPYTPTAMAATTEQPNVYFEILPSITSEKFGSASNYTIDSEQRPRVKNRKIPSRDPKQTYSVIQDLRTPKELGSVKSSALTRKFMSKKHPFLIESALDSDSRGKLKYGDKI